MPTLTLLAAVVASLQEASDDVTLFGKKVSLSFPSGGPFGQQTPFKEVSGIKFATAPDGTLTRPFLVDGGWEDFKTLYAKSKSVTPTQTLRFRVMVMDYVLSLDKRSDGRIVKREGYTDGDDRDALIDALATFKGMVIASTGGRFKVEFDATWDSDVLVINQPTSTPPPIGKGALHMSPVLESDDFPFGRGFVERQIAPRFNDEKFDADDGVYRGPYDGVFVIHAGLSGATLTWRVDHTPVTVLPYFLAGDRKARESVPTQLYETWKDQLRVCLETQPPQPLMTPTKEFPECVFGKYGEAMVERARDRSNKPASAVPLKGSSSSALAALPLRDPDPPGATPVSVETAVVAESIQGTTAVGWSGSKLLLAFDQKQLDELEGHMKGPAGTAPPDSLDAGDTRGDYSTTKTGDGTATTWEITQAGKVPRGFVSLGTPSGATGSGDNVSLKAQVRLSADERLGLTLMGRSGRKVATVFLGGEAPSPGGTPAFDGRVPADDQWHDMRVVLGKASEFDLAEVRVTHSGPGLMGRLARTPVKLGIKGLSLELTADAPSGLAAPETWTNESLLDALKDTSAERRNAALSHLGGAKLPSAVPQLTELATSASIDTAVLATTALAFQDTPEGWAAIKRMVERGPFDTNRQFAAMALAQKPDPTMAASLNLMTSRSWRARWHAVRALGQINTQSSNIILASMILQEPDPVIRREIVAKADPSVDFVARRMLYAAVNDTSQWVRGTAYARLIDSADRSVLSEALNGVKDDAVGVRLMLLGLMRDRAKESYRPALRQAVVDTVSSVRAAALRAFATQPGPVDPNEVKNTFTDKDPEVRAALLDLAKAKGFEVPPQ